jgi:hypothetical protein
LFCLGLISLSWAAASLHDGLAALHPFIRLLAIPFLIVQFRKSDNGHLVIRGYLVACTILLAVALVSSLFPAVVPILGLKYPGQVVKDLIVQSGECALCGFGLLLWAGTTWATQRYTHIFITLPLAALFFVAILYVQTARTELIIFAVIFALLFRRWFGWKGIPIGLALAGSVFALAWVSSPYLRFRVNHVTWELQEYYQHDRATSAGDRLEWWRKSLEFVRAAPVIGHGVGSIKPLFAAKAVGESGVSAVVTANPHNQIFAIAIELGLVGVAALFAMWIAHVRLFQRVVGLPWLGMIVVVQNIVGSLFNSHLFDFTQGWTYVFGVGVLGGMALSPTKEHFNTRTDPVRLWFSRFAGAFEGTGGSMSDLTPAILCAVTGLLSAIAYWQYTELHNIRATLRAAMRAYVVLDEGYVSKLDGTYKVVAELKNGGSTPALDVTRWIGAAVVPPKGEIAKLNFNDTGTVNNDIAPNGRFDIAEARDNIVPKELAEKDSGWSDLYILGLVKYRDVFQQCQYSSFISFAGPADSTGRRKLVVFQARSTPAEGKPCSNEGKADFP